VSECSPHYDRHAEDWMRRAERRPDYPQPPPEPEPPTGPVLLSTAPHPHVVPARPRKQPKAARPQGCHEEPVPARPRPRSG
jgi:hypothetical protein